MDIQFRTGNLDSPIQERTLATTEHNATVLNFGSHTKKYTMVQETIIYQSTKCLMIKTDNPMNQSNSNQIHVADKNRGKTL